MASVMHSREKLTMLGEEEKEGEREVRRGREGPSGIDGPVRFCLVGSVWRVGGGEKEERKMEACSHCSWGKKDPEPRK